METQSCPKPQKRRTLRRTANFLENETKLLIQLWGSFEMRNNRYLKHKKGSVMRLLAANMERYGFYRTPNQIGTKIRNLRYLYNNIKRGFLLGPGTVDPVWPHYKAIDNILSKQNEKRKKILYNDDVFEKPRCEELKQEIGGMDMNDGMESYTINSNGGLEFEEKLFLPPLHSAPSKDNGNEEGIKTCQNINLLNTLPNISIIPIQNQPIKHHNKQRSKPSILAPLFILNEEKRSFPPSVTSILNKENRNEGRLKTSQPSKDLPKPLPNLSISIQNQPNKNEEKCPLAPLTYPALSKDKRNKGELKIYPTKTLPNKTPRTLSIPIKNKPNTTQRQSKPSELFILNEGPTSTTNSSTKNKGSNKNQTSPRSDFAASSHILKELLKVQKANLDINRQRLEVERQRLDFERLLNSQKFNSCNEGAGGENNCRKRQNSFDINLLKDSKILKTVLIEGIKKFMLREDSEIQNDVDTTAMATSNFV